MGENKDKTGEDNTKVRPWLFSHHWDPDILRDSGRATNGEGLADPPGGIPTWYLKSLSPSGKNLPQEYVAVCAAQVSQGYKITSHEEGLPHSTEEGRSHYIGSSAARGTCTQITSSLPRQNGTVPTPFTYSQ